MSLKGFDRVACRCSVRVALIVAAGVMSGCSSDFTRFTDGMNTGSTSARQAAVSKPLPRYQKMPPAVVRGEAYGAVVSSELPPVSVPDRERETYTASLASSPGMGGLPQPLGVLPASQAEPSIKKAAATVRMNQRRTYVVQSGDTLFSIARRNETTVRELKYENELSGDLIRIGQKLTVPGSGPLYAKDTHTRTDIQVATAIVPKPDVSPVRRQVEAPEPAPAAQVVEAVAVEPDVRPEPGIRSETVTAARPQKAVVTAEDTDQEARQVAIVTPQATGISSSLMRWPVKGRILSRYGQREGTATNDGMDIMVPEGTSVKAADEGVVIYAGDGLKEFGNTILIRHEGNIVTVYGHNSRILVQRGQKVRRGDEIAKSGMSGNASSPRLHFEVRKNSAPVDPVRYMED